jgi:NADH-quinone oxidoreductase subunit C
MAEITNQYVLEELHKEFGAAILATDEPYGMLTVVIEPFFLVNIVSWFKNHPVIKADFLTDICGSHFPQLQGEELCVIYHLQSMKNNYRVRLKCFVPIERFFNRTIVELKSLTHLYSGANWMEREVYDYYGVMFEGHPNLKRILNVDEMDYFPMRKEYPLEEGTRTDKDDKYFGR